MVTVDRENLTIELTRVADGWRARTLVQHPGTSAVTYNLTVTATSEYAALAELGRLLTLGPS